MKNDAYRPYRDVIASQIVFALVLGASVFPLVQLDDHPDPLMAARWYTLHDIHSGGIAFVLALTYAAFIYFWLRAHPQRPAWLWFSLGAAIALVPGLFYAASVPSQAMQAPISLVLGSGIVWGALLGGPAYLLLRRSRTRTHDA